MQAGTGAMGSDFGMDPNVPQSCRVPVTFEPPHTWRIERYDRTRDGTALLSSE
jgi:hypothetical protein